MPSAAVKKDIKQIRNVLTRISKDSKRPSTRKKAVAKKPAARKSPASKSGPIVKPARRSAASSATTINRRRPLPGGRSAVLARMAKVRAAKARKR